MAVANNADDYAASRQNIFFPAHNQTPADGNLTGQCVTLNKWFLAEMTTVPNPFSARGDARYVGRTLVNQGHAIEVPYNQRRRGDFICYEYGTYGHIALQLSGGRVFEQNVNMGGVARRFVDGAYVYASRIASENEAWRADKNPHVYRIKSYVEPGGNMAGIPNSTNWFWRMNKLMDQVRNRGISQAEFEKNFVGTDPFRMVEIISDSPEADQATADQKLGSLARRDNWQGQIYGLLDQVNNLSKRPTVEERDALVKQAEELQTQMELAKTEADAAKKQAEADRAKAKELELEKEEDTKVGNAFLRWLGNLIKGNK